MMCDDAVNMIGQLDNSIIICFFCFKFESYYQNSQG